MDLESIKLIFSENLSLGLVALMSVAAVGDFAAATIEHLRAGTFSGTLWGKWAGEKGLAILSVSLLFALDYATKFLNVSVGDFDLGLFGLTATAQAGSFIATQGFSIVKHFQPKPIEEPVPDEIVGG